MGRRLSASGWTLGVGDSQQQFAKRRSLKMTRLRTLGLALVAVFAMSAVAIAAPAFASEQLWLNEAETAHAPVGTTWHAVNVGSPKLTASIITVTCTSSIAEGEITKNEPTGLTSSVTKDTFSGCTDQLGNAVTVTTTTSPAWTLTWTAAKTLKLTGISATITDSGLGQTCHVANSSSAFNLAWVNAATDSTLGSSSAPLALSGSGCSATSGTETAKYSVNLVDGASGNLWMN
jgi:hypothetical protein